MAAALSVNNGVIRYVGADMGAVVEQAIGTDPHAQQYCCSHANYCHLADPYPPGNDCAWRQMCMIPHDAVVADDTALIDDDVVPNRTTRPNRRSSENMTTMADHGRIGNGRGRMNHGGQVEAYGRSAFKHPPSLLI